MGNPLSAESVKKWLLPLQNYPYLNVSIFILNIFTEKLIFNDGLLFTVPFVV